MRQWSGNGLRKTSWRLFVRKVAGGVEVDVRVAESTRVVRRDGAVIERS